MTLHGTNARGPHRDGPVLPVVPSSLEPPSLVSRCVKFWCEVRLQWFLCYGIFRGITLSPNGRRPRRSYCFNIIGSRTSPPRG